MWFEFFRFAPPRFVRDDGGTECARGRDRDGDRDADRDFDRDFDGDFDGDSDRGRLSRFSNGDCVCGLVSTDSSSIIASSTASLMLSGSCGGGFVKNLSNLVNNDCWGGGGDGDGDGDELSRSNSWEFHK